MRDRFFVLFLLMGLLLLSNVFAGDLVALSDRDSVVADITKLTASTDNIKIYDAETQTAVVKDKTGATTYASIKLLTPLNNKVSLGYQKVAEFEIDGKTSYSDFLKQMYFFDVKNNNAGIKRGFDLKKKVITQVEEPVYELVETETLDKNENPIFENKLVGSKFVNVTDYELLSEKNFGVEKQIVSMWVQIDKPEKIEWIPELYGAVINEWAQWTSDLNVGLISYWKLDETTGTTAYDANATSANNGTNTNSVDINIAGKVGKAYGSFNDNKHIALGSQAEIKFGYNIPFSICMWAKPNATGIQDILYEQAKGTTGNVEWGFDTWYGGANKLGFFINKSGTAGYIATANNAFSAGTWYFICGTNTPGTNGIKLYVDGVLQTTVGNWGSGATNAPTGTASIGNFVAATNGFNGIIDEVGIWSRALSESDVNYMYNGGTGMTIGGSEVISKSRITWNVFKSGTSTHLTTVTIDCNVNAMDASGQNSPFSSSYVDTNTNFSCDFSSAGYDSNTGVKGVVDSNKSLTIYLTESLPTVGQTVQKGFTLYSTTYIKGDGNISTLASSAGGIASCYYTQNGASWLNADYNTTHCVKTGLSIVNGETYKWNFKATNNVGGDANGTPIATLFTGDTLAPTTTVVITDYNNSPYKFIHATCSDAGSGCKSITFEFDNNGTKFLTAGATKDLNFYGLGYHSLKVYSTDNLDTNEVAQTFNLNMPVLLTIKYPKNIATLNQITEKWILRSTGAITLNLTDLNTDYNIYVLPNVLTTFYIGDVNGNYTENIYTRTYYNDSNTGYDTLQPYLYAINTSLATTINVLNKNTLAPLKSYTIKFYGNLPGIGNTLIGQGTTDDKGQILQLFTASQAYVWEVYNPSNTLLGSFNYTAINNVAYVYYNFLSIYVSSLPPVDTNSNTDINGITTEFFILRNTFFDTCTTDEPCFPSALVAIVLTILALITATSVSSGAGAFIGVKGLSVIAFCSFTIFFGIGFLPLFIYAFLGTITLLMAVLTQ